jgi:hypothetical protein
MKNNHNTKQANTKIQLTNENLNNPIEDKAYIEKLNRIPEKKMKKEDEVKVSSNNKDKEKEKEKAPELKILKKGGLLAAYKRILYLYDLSLF